MKRAVNAFFRRSWGSEIEKETRRRILVSIAAYAYEVLDRPIMSDARFDKLCRSVNLNQRTANPKMDRWFRTWFKPHTGMWIHQHPNKERLRTLAAFMEKQK